MAGGSPFEIYNIFGTKLPRYQVSAIVIGVYATALVGLIQYNKYKTQPPLKLEAEEASFVEKYIHHHHADSKKPVLLRTPFSMTSHQ
ncbi:hypothetical protein BASA50_006072 [Batrachochytrium salamandrivorans]|uniref:ATP synthase subunit e, mitochondrial n=1 Tax=Batrachochytrium salamandrivorans TaxID=1357716 RepID=A0ABQ8FAT4_9FUNG|nr:hypothetical protein BASA62_010121 [Batrachochytrium salamandrivorans]KAH6562992.1 hypothetical protein BASA60_010909 [Batrachochytrium salamandrivorans]KAH6595085.1 hypothetical protein BASA50_006072 [Batrachochytrium salamandrivorans]KAH6600911.1 hypothetical protein BASA61_002123 [Batrachochytrium salamandrivorans]KAH9252536.1 hypothetical protein BASA81_009495 [Batrachochytrium salamandrivorans]